MSTNEMIVLSGDIGGTSSRLLLSHFQNGQLKPLYTKNYTNIDHIDFEDIVQQFLQETDLKTITTACFGVAGPVINGEVKLTNLPWSLSEKQLSRSLNMDNVKFINDFLAIAYAIDHISSSQYITLQHAKKQLIGTKIIIGAGTGLGTAILHYTNQQLSVIATEAGHCEFAPVTKLQLNLLTHLKKKFHRVSVERIVSGIGITNIYKFMRSLPEFQNIEHRELKKLAMSSQNFSDKIEYYATHHHDPIALQTLDLFIRCYGSFCGNIALTTLPYSGLYIAGGIAPKLSHIMQDGRFLDTYGDKGRMSSLLQNIPIHLIMDTQIGLHGAAHYAIQHQPSTKFLVSTTIASF